jgi:cell division transport system permease protein
MFRAIAHDFHEAFTGLSRHVAMALSAANAVMVTLVLVSVLSIIVANVSQITTKLEKDIRIYATISNEVSDDAVPTIMEQINAINGVTKTTFSSKDEELDMFIQSYGSLFEAYRQDNPLERAVYIDVQSGTMLSQISQQISAISGVNKVEFGGNTVEDFITILNDVRLGGLVFVIALTILAMFLINNTINMTIHARQPEIAIMRNVGATNGYIRRPFVLEGVFIGLLGAVIPVLLTIFGYQWVYNSLGGELVSNMLTLLPVAPFAYYLAAALAGLGMLVGFLGSFISVNRYLRWRR